MTTLAIIGGGIAGRSLIYALAKQKKIFSKIVLFDSSDFATPCSLNSTAIVAPRGLTPNLSELGDTLINAFATFSQHVRTDSPHGVYPVTQYTAAVSKLDQFTKRYPKGEIKKDFSHFSLQHDIYMATENAYLIDPAIYLDWLISSGAGLPLTIKKDFVVSVDDKTVKTVNGEEFHFDNLVFAGGKYNQFWAPKKTAKTVQGSYLEFSEVDLGAESFSVTLEGDNLIYRAPSQTLLIGSTSQEVMHQWPLKLLLDQVYERLSNQFSFTLPPKTKALIRTGLREKASKRIPYLYQDGHTFYVGGFYKNGFSLGLEMGQKLASYLVAFHGSDTFQSAPTIPLK